MPDYVEPPSGFNPQPYIEKALPEIVPYTAIFVLQDGRIGSGVFVNACGLDGILTAHHVAKPVLESERFALCVSSQTHSLWLASRHFEHVPIAYQKDNPHPEKGPDLSFIIIRDTGLLGTLRSMKSFCFLESQNRTYFDNPLDRQLWAVAGSPYEAKAIVEPESANKGALTKVQNFVGYGYFESRTERNGFDYIALRMSAGGNDFPDSYAGVSGGGFWLIPLEVDANGDLNTVAHGKPVLAGIAFHQSETENQERILTGHGFDSIYVGVMNTLKQRRVRAAN